MLRLKKIPKQKDDEQQKHAAAKKNRTDVSEADERQATASTASLSTAVVDAIRAEQEAHTRQRLLIERLEVLLGDRYTFNGTRIAVNAQFCEQLNDRVASQRPQRRQDKCLDVQQRFATLMPDVTRCFDLPKFDRRLFTNDITLTIEIKVRLHCCCCCLL